MEHFAYMAAHDLKSPARVISNLVRQMEEGSELAHRITNNGVLPMMTSCSPAWIRYVETFKPEFAPQRGCFITPETAPV